MKISYKMYFDGFSINVLVVLIYCLFCSVFADENNEDKEDSEDFTRYFKDDNYKPALFGSSAYNLINEQFEPIKHPKYMSKVTTSTPAERTTVSVRTTPKDEDEPPLYYRQSNASYVPQNMILMSDNKTEEVKITMKPRLKKIKRLEPSSIKADK